MSEVEVKAKVTVKPIKKAGWLPPDHDGAVRYTSTFQRLVVNRDSSTGTLLTGLTPEQERMMEKKLQMREGELSKYNMDFWGTFFIDINSRGRVLDPNDPKHELILMVLQNHPEVANSEVERIETPGALYVISSGEDEQEYENKKTKVRKEAYKKFTAMTTTELIDIFNVMNPDKKLSLTSDPDRASSAVEKIVIDNPEKFLSTLDDPMLKMKAFIEKCIQLRIVSKLGSKYATKDGIQLGYSLSEAVDYLNNPENQDVLIGLKGKIETKS